MKFILFTNIPAPYRVFFFNELEKRYSEDFKIVYLAKTESNRKWDIPNIQHNYEILQKANFLATAISILKLIKRDSPEIVITSGFNLKMLFCWLYALLTNKKHYLLTDSWLLTVNQLTIFHRVVRKVVFKSTEKFICIGKKGKEYLETYGVPKEQIFITPLVIDNAKFLTSRHSARKYDLMFAGQFIERKSPFFFLDVVLKLNSRIPNLKVLLIGSGVLENKIREKLDAENIDYSLPGFIQQEDLPKYYSASKVFLFPTKSDPWGIVANEAIAAGTPVITCDNAGVAGDLVIDSFNGCVLPLDVNTWADKTQTLLADNEKWQYFSKNGIGHINKNFSINNAINGYKEVLK